LEVEINRVFSELKKERLLKEHTEKIKKTVDVLRDIRARCVARQPAGEPQPSVGDLFHIKAILNASIKCAQDPDSSPASVLQFVEDKYWAFREQCMQRCRRLLLEQLDLAEKEKQEKNSEAPTGTHKKPKPTNKDKKSSSKLATATELEVKPAPEVDRLMLATSFFRCEWCSKHSLRFPDVFAHRCARRTDVAGYSREEKEKSWVSEALSTGGGGEPLYEGVWNFCLAIYKLNEAQIANLVAVLELLKLDPETTTFDEIERLNPVFECLRCHSFSEGRCLMDWTAIVSYLFNLIAKSTRSLIIIIRRLLILKNVTSPWML